MEYLISIVGPTAIGKSQLAIYLAQNLNGEIVNGDSRQVYRYMDIGTAKLNPSQRALVPHHLIDMVSPDETSSLGIYQKLAFETIADIQRRGRLPFLVGGSGLYIWSVIEGWKIPQVPPNSKLRRNLEARAKREGSYSLYSELEKKDPLAAIKIAPENVRRIIRALEIYKTVGEPASQLWQKEPPPFHSLIIGLTADRGDLYQRIDLRVEEMIKQGLLEEVKGLVKRGYGLNLPSMSGIGYKQIGKFLQGELELPAAIQQIKYETHRLARHQYTWFRLKDERIHWFDITNSKWREKAKELVEDFLANLKDEAS